MSLPRLVATDLDGTLVRSDGTVSDRTPATCSSSVERRGVPVVFVTGRPLRWTEEVFEYVGAHGLAVVSNGALVWDVARAEVAPRARAIDPRLGLEVCRAICARRSRARRSPSRRSTGIGARAGVHGAAPGARRRPARRRSRSSSTEPALKLLARHEELGPAGVLGPGRGGRAAAGW